MACDRGHCAKRILTGFLRASSTVHRFDSHTIYVLRLQLTMLLGRKETVTAPHPVGLEGVLPRN